MLTAWAIVANDKMKAKEIAARLRCFRTTDMYPPLRGCYAKSSKNRLESGLRSGLQSG
jgi:hypothetical protein